MKFFILLKVVGNKMRISIVRIAFFIIFSFVSVGLSVQSQADDNKQKKRVAYYQGGDYIDYYKTLRSIAVSFHDLGVFTISKGGEIPEFQSGEAKLLWQWLSENTDSDQIEFVADAFYSSGWSQEQRVNQRQIFLNRLNMKSDIDLVFALGSWAGLDLANEEHSTSVMVMSSSDPISAGIIEQQDDSGLDHVHVFINPERYLNQIRIFHNLIGFKRLGIAYENTKVGRSYAAVDTIYSIAKDKGFTVIPCYTKSDIPSEEVASESIVSCFEYLADKVDSFYVTEQGGLDLKTHEKIIAIANKYKIPAFSQYGQDEVKFGYMLSASRSYGLIKEGRFLANVAIEILKGKKPREINQVFNDHPDIYLNMKTAELIGFHLNAYLLAAADKLYWRIENQE
ncbi:ABC transporter substrate binding protein [Neptunomonas phycophila]|uniref:ABC transporter substrate binding protein n=1 Tax=Neptunomonas phycophila TaxID=1572645 RepID=A0ABT9EUQ3_9GAMM|nr:ABC transporter substrate binding protein [Neptunomonas phycophila]MDP2522736.1 ABC transporter substrate binding protein [Neptunomonas phycophila]